MKKLFCMLIAAMVIALLSGCYGKGSSADPPANFTATAGDGRVMLTWTPASGVDYWLFAAASPSLTAFNWSGLPYALAYINAPTPFYMCGLFDDVQYYFAANGRINGGPGGPSSPTITAMPYNASASTWNTGSASPATNLYGIGYASLTSCSNLVTTSSTGKFAVVGAGGAIYTSYDGQSWNAETSPTSSDLYAVAGYAADQNNALLPALRWMAVGNAGTVVYYQDSTGWVDANSLPGSNLSTVNPANTLRSVTQVAGTFYAVGDSGTIISTSDGINWTHRPYNSPNPTTENLNGVTHGSIFVAVGDNGTILISGDGNTWTPPTTISPAILSGTKLRQAISFAGIYGSINVAVGDNGTIVTSDSYHGINNWSTQTLTGNPQLVGITVELRAVDPAITSSDPSLGVISTAQFVAVDNNGNAYTSVNGYDWSAAIPTGASSLNTLVSSGFGYVAAGNSGVTAYAF